MSHAFAPSETEAEAERAPLAADSAEATLPLRSEGPFPSGSSFHQALVEEGFSPAQVQAMIDDVRPVYNLARVRAGHRLMIERDREGSLAALEYDIDEEEFLRIEPDSQGGYRADRLAFDFRLEEFQIEGVIESSLWNSILQQGGDSQLVMMIANLFQWDVDFTTAQPGDSFSVIVQRRFKEGEPAGYGDILAGRYSSGSKDFYAFLFHHPERGKNIYYDRDGQAVRKAFLKVPFAFNPRVTSGYSYSRFHPIHKVRRPHLGVDYGAPYGTPVLASASGRVILAGRNGGFGKMVRVRHANGYVTGYAHLSRIAVKVGQAVQQGQMVGRVGSTGVSTGPHLDYRVQDRSGRYINPRQMISWPSDKPLEEKHLPAFKRLRDAFQVRIMPQRIEGCEVT
ncbi:MAG TPA: peptidoglycan DD-metalloendopeptidase family protein [Acidobacteriota bacterium]|nr:peptidoglycan DD-metalloendopeptidase family protein [Acidobacteriota bacterium]